MSKEPEKEQGEKHSKERREVVKAAASISLLAYMPPIIKTFLIDGGMGLPTPQGQSARARAVQQALARGLRGGALVQAVNNLISP